MAVKGDVGKIMFHNAAGTEADVSDLRAWSLSVSQRHSWKPQRWETHLKVLLAV